MVFMEARTEVDGEYLAQHHPVLGSMVPAMQGLGFMEMRIRVGVCGQFRIQIQPSLLPVTLVSEVIFVPNPITLAFSKQPI